MPTILSLDPGKSSGIALGRFSDDQGYELIDHWTILGGIHGFIQWAGHYEFLLERSDVVVCEDFKLTSSPVVPDTTPLLIKGTIEYLARDRANGVVYQLPSQKGLLVRPGGKSTQSERFKWLKQQGFNFPGTANDDLNDAITHALVYLKRTGHRPTIEKFWPSGQR